MSGAVPLDAGPGETVVMAIRHGLTVLNRDRRVAAPSFLFAWAYGFAA